MNPKHKKLTMTYLPEDRESGFVPDEDSEETDEVEVSPAGDVTIGVPLIQSFAIPTNDEQENE